LQRLIEVRLPGLVDIITPGAASERGCQLSLRIERSPAAAKRCHDQLSAAGVVADWREPDVLRLAPSRSTTHTATCSPRLTPCRLRCAGENGTRRGSHRRRGSHWGTASASCCSAAATPWKLYESRSDPRQEAAESGRSINLALADRGIHALQLAGVFPWISSGAAAERGRLIHHAEGGTSLQTLRATAQ